MSSARRCFRRRRRRFFALITLAIAASGAPAARAQFDQFAQPGGATFGSEPRQIGSQDRFDEALRNSRWRLGKLYVDPWIGFRDIGYVGRVDLADGGQLDSGLTATAGAGIDTYLPLGQNVTWASHASPLYVWFQEEEDRNRLNLDASTGLYGRLGRVGLELDARRSERLRMFSQEVPQQVNMRRDQGQLRLSIPVVGGFTLFGNASTSRIESLEDPELLAVPFQALDRDELVFDAGIGYRFRRGILVQLGVGHSEVELAEGSLPLDNEGNALILRLSHGTEWIGFDADLAYRELDPRGAQSQFLPFRGVAGRTGLQWKLSRWAAPEVYFRRNLVYSLAEQAAYFVDTRYGLGIRSRPVERLQLRAFVENGSNDYHASRASAASPREDDVFTYGGTVATRIGWLNAGVTAYRSDFDSNVPGFDRDVTVVQSHVSLSVGLRLGGDLIWD
ncbi:MAG TPA: hypothetical protein VMT16_07600 [Thermoanaerobaculia bacterium]|nr:hypothetical protein [Thermoanaerobaculia bacterium]